MTFIEVLLSSKISKSPVALCSVPAVGLLVPTTKSLSLSKKVLSAIVTVPIFFNLLASFTFTLIAPAVEFSCVATTFLNVLPTILILLTFTSYFAPLPKLRSIPAALLLIKSSSGFPE